MTNKIEKRNNLYTANNKRTNEVLNHLKRVLNEIEKLIVEIQEKPNSPGHLEHRLFLGNEGDPHYSIWSKNNQKIKKNSWGEYVGLDCVDEMIMYVADSLMSMTIGLTRIMNRVLKSI